MRQQNWPVLLDVYIRDNKDASFNYGRSDCVRFCARWIHLATGKTVLKGIKYSGLISGLKILKGGGGLWNLTARQMQMIGNREIPVFMAKRGDIIGFITDRSNTDPTHGESVGICTGREFVGPGGDGMAFLPMSEARRAWEVV